MTNNNNNHATAEVKLHDVCQTFQRSSGEIVKAVSEVNLTFKPHEFVCVIGPSGCGKTTLLQQVAGLLDVTSGTISVDGIPINGPSPERGLVFQKDSVFPWMRVIDNAAYGLKCRGMGRSERNQIARKYLAQVGLDHVEHSWPRELSGGMLKRVAVATVFCQFPQSFAVR